MRNIDVTIEGVTPLLIHRFAAMDDLDAAPVRAGADRGTPEEQAKVSAYAHPDGTLYQPSEHIRQSLVAAATSYHKIGRKGAGGAAAAGIVILPDALTHELQAWHVDSRPVVIQATKGRIIRHRPMLDNWRVSFTLSYDETILDPRMVRLFVDDAGSKIGIGDYRPQKRGPYGRFNVVRWEEAKH